MVNKCFSSIDNCFLSLRLLRWRYRITCAYQLLRAMLTASCVSKIPSVDSLAQKVTVWRLVRFMFLRSFGSFQKRIRIIYPSRVIFFFTKLHNFWTNVWQRWVFIIYNFMGINVRLIFRFSARGHLPKIPLIACGIFKDFKASWNSTTTLLVFHFVIQ